VILEHGPPSSAKPLNETTQSTNITQVDLLSNVELRREVGNKVVMKPIHEAPENELTPCEVEVYHKTVISLYIMFCILNAKVVT
jgi:hypothetical protein